MSRQFAVIGTRDITVEHMRWIDAQLQREQQLLDDSALNTGAADGCDQYAAEHWLALSTTGRVKLWLPWDDYNAPWCDKLQQRFPQRVERCRTRLIEYERTLVADHHGSWSRVSRGAAKLHYRNYEIVRHADVVYACPGWKPWGGGTAMGIKIATHLRKEVQVYDIQGRDWSHCGC